MLIQKYTANSKETRKKVAMGSALVEELLNLLEVGELCKADGDRLVAGRHNSIKSSRSCYSINRYLTKALKFRNQQIV